jgi:hypothetical protein
VVQALDPVPIILEDGNARFGPGLAAQGWALARWRTPAVLATLCGTARSRRAAAAVGELLTRSLSPTVVETRRSGAGCLTRGPAAAYVILAPSKPAPAEASKPQP